MKRIDGASLPAKKDMAVVSNNPRDSTGKVARRMGLATAIAFAETGASALLADVKEDAA
jgi:hypothetical protein